MKSGIRLALLLLPLLPGCATMESVRPAGATRVYNYPLPLVFDAAKTAAGDLGLAVEEEAPDKSYFTARRGLAAWSWGEVIGVYLVMPSPDKTEVTVRSRRRFAANTTATDFTGKIHDALGPLLVALSSGAKDGDATPGRPVAPATSSAARLGVAHAPTGGPAPVIGTHWAVIIGVSQYRDSRIPSLRYAASDARAFHDWTVSPSGGRYAPSRVKLLLDEDATGSNIKDALFDWLRQAIAEDVVTIFFAGHGSSDTPDSNENLFFLPVDTDYERISTSGFPMWDVETALRRFVRARKVIVIADACHSGGVGQSFDVARRSNRGVKVNAISTAFQHLSKVGDGVCVISASDAAQMSQEGEAWGGGRGVFTHFLLEGLEGKADYSKDGRVTLGELIPYVSEQVRRTTRSAQSPTVAGQFDPALSIGK